MQAHQDKLMQDIMAIGTGPFLTRRRLFIAAWGFAIATGSFSAAAAPIGLVHAMVGQALIETTGNTRAMKVGDPLAAGDILRTAPASRLTLRLGRNTVIHLGAETTLKIERYLADAGGEFELASGGLFYQNDGASRARPDKTVVRSPYGLLAVRGTRFFAGPSRGAFGVFVDQGRVDVTAAGRSVRVSPGLGTTVTYPGSRPSTPTVWKPQRIREAYVSTLGRTRR